MFRYIILFLVSIYSSNFGNSLPLETSKNLLHDSFVSLAKRCDNSYLSSQINSKLDECSIIVPPYNEKQFECLIFYDINTQLCDAIAANKIEHLDSNTDKINVSIDVGELCEAAKTWNVSDVIQYPLYKNTVKKVFDHSLTCQKVCGADDITSQDANFFCKYFKWGSDLLTHATNTVSSQSIVPSKPSDVKTDDQHAPVESSNHLDTADNILQNKSDSQTPDSIKALSSKTDVSSPLTGEEPVNEASSTNKEPSQVESEVPDKSAADTKVLSPDVAPEKVILNAATDTKVLEKPIATEQQVIKKNEEKLPELEETLKAPDQKESDIDNTKQVGEPDDYQDSEEAKGSDLQSDDDGDDNMLGDPDIKQDQIQTKNTPKKFETPISSYNGEMELFPNAMQDGFPNNDDHFFPFFLSAVILVVLLYVLYHNKSKVSKVFLGLIVEGRQSGRRRNSRGHAYRRLDTLEQAMSANTAAPPSKIIY